MNIHLKSKFEQLFAQYFPGAELPLIFYYSDNPPPEVEAAPPAKGWRCFVADLVAARQGRSLCLDEAALGCGKRYCGFRVPLRPNFEYFLSSGIPGQLEGERYKKTPELVNEIVTKWPTWQAPAKYLIIKRWDNLLETDRPEAAIFFAPPDVLSGLFTLANYEESEPYGVITPFAAGCGTIIQYPFLENQQENPRCVLGMFDVSARPCVKAHELTFSAPMKKFERMINNIEESFVITHSWSKVMRRLEKAERG
jgi:hypothetical protein